MTPERARRGGAVEVDPALVPRADHAGHALAEGDAVETGGRVGGGCGLRARAVGAGVRVRGAGLALGVVMALGCAAPDPQPQPTVESKARGFVPWEAQPSPSSPIWETSCHDGDWLRWLLAVRDLEPPASNAPAALLARYQALQGLQDAMRRLGWEGELPLSDRLAAVVRPHPSPQPSSCPTPTPP